MKGAAFELERALGHIEQGDFSNATRLIRRALQLAEPPIELLHILETITPYDYHLIRAGLGHGSGLDSPGFLSLLHLEEKSVAEIAILTGWSRPLVKVRAFRARARVRKALTALQG